ncbi:MAG: nucleotide exchange factor GrpE [Ruminococcaceae bacterium]|nr:nucleotide exchange factor GrpE [Oscillospiraceae bacterium]
MAEEKNMNKIDFEETEEEILAEESKETKKEKKSDSKKLRAELEEAQQALEAEKARADETNDKYLRLAAEYDNFRKRTQTERKNVYTEAVTETLSGLLPILDNLQYAAKYSGGDAEKVAAGLEMILSKLPETLEKMNIKAFGAAGETFDPNIHNAILHVEDESFGEGEIVEVLQQGYMYGERVLRYAMVKVAN